MTPLVELVSLVNGIKTTSAVAWSRRCNILVVVVGGLGNTSRWGGTRRISRVE
jgi:hypothetical protein